MSDETNPQPFLSVKLSGVNVRPQQSEFDITNLPSDDLNTHFPLNVYLCFLVELH